MFSQLRKKSGEPKKEETGTQRLEAFSDGVFAIAITLLILEIHVPHLPEAATGAQLRTAILALWPSYFAYIFSFVTVGIYWANHHYIFNIYKKTDHIFNLINIFFLMCISFLPLPTEVLGEYMHDENKRQVAIIFYNFGLFLPAASWCLSWMYASKNNRLIDPNLAPEFVQHYSRQYKLSFLLFLAALVVSFWNGIAGIVIAVGLTMTYLMPPKARVYREGKEAAEMEEQAEAD